MSKALKSFLLLVIMTSLNLGQKNWVQNSVNGLNTNASLLHIKANQNKVPICFLKLSLSFRTNLGQY